MVKNQYSVRVFKRRGSLKSSTLFKKRSGHKNRRFFNGILTIPLKIYDFYDQSRAKKKGNGHLRLLKNILFFKSVKKL